MQPAIKPSATVSVFRATAAYQQHRLNFQNEYQPATPTETHLVQELADTSWRQNRIPLLESALFSQVPSPPIPLLSRLSANSKTPANSRPPQRRRSPRTP